MADEPTDMTTDILVAIRKDISSFRASVEGRFGQVEEKLDRLEQISRKHRHDAAATMVIMRATVSHFNQRVGTIEERVTAPEAPKS